ASRGAPDETEPQRFRSLLVDAPVEALAIAEGDRRRRPGEEAQRRRRAVTQPPQQQRLVERHVRGAVDRLSYQQPEASHVGSGPQGPPFISLAPGRGRGLGW